MNIILDSNLLLLLIVGLASQDYIATHRRLQIYTIEDFILLQRILAAAAKVVVTPNILTETSNLAGYVTEPARTRIYRVLKALMEDAAAIEERYIESRQAVGCAGRIYPLQTTFPAFSTSYVIPAAGRNSLKLYQNSGFCPGSARPRQ